LWLFSAFIHSFIFYFLYLYTCIYKMIIMLIHYTITLSGRMKVSLGCKLNAMLCIQNTRRENGHIKRQYIIHILLYNWYNMSLWNEHRKGAKLGRSFMRHGVCTVYCRVHMWWRGAWRLVSWIRWCLNLKGLSLSAVREW
jgi:hypothetical protein